MDRPFKVFILAAGLGERLRPITNHIPKPLMPILGKPVLQNVLERVSKLQADNIGINLHHKADMIEAWIKQSAFNKKIELFHEKTVLNTGGGLKNAEDFLNDSTFLVHNSDILSDIDLERLIEAHYSSENLITLAVHDRPEFNCLDLDENGYLKAIVKNRSEISEKKLLAFTGVAVYSAEFIKYLPEGASGVVDAWLSAISDGQKIGTLDVTGCFWSDIGTPHAYSKAVFDALKIEAETLYVHPSVQRCEDVQLNAQVVIEKGNALKKGMSFKNCILLPESRTRENSRYENCILGPDLKIDISNPEPGDKYLIGTGGSDRAYYRINRGGKTEVLMQCPHDDPDFKRHMEYTDFFLRHSIPVPELIRTDRQNMSAVFEDLGDISLYTWLRCPRKKDRVEAMYKKVIDMLIQLHSIPAEQITECPMLQQRVFDREHFLWETSYFMERFVKGIHSIEVKDLPSLEKEFHSLASKADSFPKIIIHRDFQSQNIMITDSETPRLIDFQGARIGPPAYDVASILWDPYHRLEDDIREGLLNYYTSKIKGIKEDEFRESLILCRLQRHMQALGAYGFLSAVKGRKYFMKHVPEGTRLLKEDISLLDKDLPALYELVMAL